MIFDFDGQFTAEDKVDGLATWYGVKVHTSEI